MVNQPIDIVKAVRNAGVIGAGGGGFPTYVKLQSKVNTIIANNFILFILNSFSNILWPSRNSKTLMNKGFSALPILDLPSTFKNPVFIRVLKSNFWPKRPILGLPDGGGGQKS